MKTLKYILLAILPLFALYSCEDEVGNPSFADDDIPRIYMEWQEYTARKLGDTLNFKPQVSPSDGATYRWTLDGKELTNTKDLSYKIAEEMIGVLEFEVTRNGVTNTRTTTVLAPRKFEPKKYKKKSIGFLTKNGSLADVDWENITHLVISSAVVEKGGALKMSNLADFNMNTLVTYAHHYGVYTMLEFSGLLNSYVNAAPAYASYTFYDTAISGIANTLADNIIAEAKNQGVDGINIYMDKAADGAFLEPEKLASFYTALGDKFKSSKNTIEGKSYDYLLSMTVVGGWTRGSLATCVNIPTYDWVNVLAFAAEDLNPGPHSAQWYAEQEVGVWLGWQGPIDPSRVVLAVPAFGLRYTGTPEKYTWGNLEDYTEYIPYKTICSTYEGASAKNTIVLVENNGEKTKPVDKIYYDGINEIKAKADYAISKDIAGMALWSIENDSKNGEESLIKTMNKALGN